MQLRFVLQSTEVMKTAVAQMEPRMEKAESTGLLDESALFLGQWGLRGVKGGEGPSYEGRRRGRAH